MNTDLFAKADVLLSDISEQPSLTQGELDMLRKAHVINFIYNSNAIEGNSLSLEETAIVLNEGIAIGGKTIKEHLEVMGHKEACAYMEDLATDKRPLTETMLKDIHALVLMDRQKDGGLYRRLSVMILGSSAEPTDPHYIPVQMEQLLYDYQNSMQELHPIERAALFHLRFESIHPFIDGNGRTGRLVMNLELMKAGFIPIDVKFTERQKYMDAFRAWNLDRDGTPMTELVDGYVVAELENRMELLEQVNYQTDRPTL